jgi:hypothetical protein
MQQPPHEGIVKEYIPMDYNVLNIEGVNTLQGVLSSTLLTLVLDLYGPNDWGSPWHFTCYLDEYEYHVVVKIESLNRVAYD